MKKADPQITCQRPDIIVKEAVGHGCIKQGSYDAPMKDAVVTLQAAMRLKPGINGAMAVKLK